MAKVHSERAKCHIESLPSGSFRVKVYAGLDPTTGKERRYRKTVKTEVEALETLAKLLREVEAEREPQEAATLDYVLTRYLEVADLEFSTREAHEGYIRRTIRPVLGDVRIGKLRADMLDSLYTHLKRCSRLCNRLPKIEHRTEAEHACDALCGPLKDHRTPRSHQCDQRCTPHRCKPMAAGSILRIHAIISAALNLAVRYDWIDRNVAEKATPPQPKKREPDPPTPKQAARLLNELWETDPEFALFVWLATTTGARRGELVGLRRHRIDFEAQEIRITRNYLVKAGQQIEKDTKTGEGRRLSLVPSPANYSRNTSAAASTRSTTPEWRARRTPSSSPQTPQASALEPRHHHPQVRALCPRHRHRSSLKELRHYSATQLLSNGIDLRTVAGRLGHSGGGVTTLRFYAQFTRPADQQAAAMLSNQLEGLRKRDRPAH